MYHNKYSFLSQLFDVTVSAGRRLQSNIVATATVKWLGPHYLTMKDVDQSEENAGLLNVIPMGIAAV